MNAAWLESLASGLAASWLAGLLWLAVVLGGAIAVRTRRPAARHGLCLWGLVGLWALAAGTWLVPQSFWHPLAVEVLPAPSYVGALAGKTEPPGAAIDTAAGVRAVAEPGRVIDPPQKTTAQQSPEPAVAAPHQPPRAAATISQSTKVDSLGPAAGQSAAGGFSYWPAVLVTVWAAGVIVGGARLWNAQRAWERLWQRALAVEQPHVQAELVAAAERCGLNGVPLLRTSDEVATAVVAGLRRPRIVIPSGWLVGVQREHLAFALRHECAHAALAHLWWQALENVTRILWWPQPLVHLLGRYLEAAREDVCDNFVLGIGAAPDYAESLLTLACRPPRSIPARVGVPLFGRPARLSHRIESLLDAARDCRVAAPRWWRGFIGVLAAALLLVLATTRWQAIAAAPAADAATQTEAEQPAVAQSDKKPGGTIRGTITHAGGQPAANVEVRLIKRPSDHYTLPLKPLRVRSDDQGQFAFHELAPGAYRAYAFAGDETTRSRAFKFANVKLDENSAQEEPLELVLRPGVKLVARVTSARTGRPLSDAVLDSRWTDTDDGFRANQHGEIIVPILTDEQWHIEVAAPGHARYTTDLKLNAPETTIDVVLEPGGQVAGRIVDEDGNPLEGVRVSAGIEGASMYRLDQKTTGADGEYHLEYLPLNTPLEISAGRDGLRSERRKASVDDQQLARQEDIELTPLPDGGSVSGRVVDAAGNPIAGAELTNMGNSTGNVRTATTDADGKFSIEKLFLRHGDRALITVRADGFAPREVELTRPQRAGQEPLDVRLAPGHRIRGRVLGADDRPLHARVYFAHGEHGFSSVGGRIDTDDQGRFESNSLPPGCTFTVYASGYSQLKDQALPLDGEEEVVVHPEPIGVIHGQVVDAKTGQPVSPYNVRITFPAQREPGDKPVGGISTTRIEVGEDFTAADGRFELGDLTSGCVFDVIVTADGYRRHVLSRATAAPTSVAKTIRVELIPIGPEDLITVAGKLVDAAGKPAAGVQVRLLGSEGNAEPFFTWVALESDSLSSSSQYSAYRRSVTNREGAFSFEDVPGWLKLSLAYWSDSVPPTRVDGLEKRLVGELSDLKLVHAQPVTLHVVVDRTAYPEAGSIAIHGPDIESLLFHRDHQLADGDTGFTFSGLQSGSLRVILYGKLTPHGTSGGFTRKSIETRKINAAPGEEIDVKFGGQ